jgi:hypothetical protein
MAGDPDWVPHGIDTTVPNAARVYDYLLDGAHNFAADRAMANKEGYRKPFSVSLLTGVSVPQ